MKTKILLALIVVAAFAYSESTALLSYQGTSANLNNGTPLASANLTVVMERVANATVIYNETFPDAVTGGRFSVMLGNNSAIPLKLNFGERYLFSHYFNNELHNVNDTYGNTVQKVPFIASQGEILTLTSAGADISSLTSNKSGTGSCTANQYAIGLNTGAPTCASVSSVNISDFTTAARLVISATGPLSYNNSTGVFEIPKANVSTDGYLDNDDWATFNNKGTGNGTMLWLNFSTCLTGGNISTAGTVTVNTSCVAALLNSTFNYTGVINGLNNNTPAQIAGFMINSTIVHTGSTSVCPTGIANVTMTTSGIVATCAAISNWDISHVHSGENITTGTIDDARLSVNTTNASRLNSGTINDQRLNASGVTASLYGSAYATPVFTVDQYGRILSAANTSIIFPVYNNLSSFTCGANQFAFGTASNLFCAQVTGANISGLPVYNNGTLGANENTSIAGLLSSNTTLGGRVNSLNTSVQGLLSSNTTTNQRIDNIPIYNNLSAMTCGANQFAYGTTSNTFCAQVTGANITGLPVYNNHTYAQFATSIINNTIAHYDVANTWSDIQTFSKNVSLTNATFALNPASYITNNGTCQSMMYNETIGILVGPGC